MKARSSCFVLSCASVLALMVACSSSDDSARPSTVPTDAGGLPPDARTPTVPEGDAGDAAPAPTAARTLAFEGITPPLDDTEKRAVRATGSVVIDGKQSTIGYHAMLRAGDNVGGKVFGALVDQDGDPITLGDGSTVVDTGSDFTSLLQVGSKLFSITHFESGKPAAMYLTELSQDKTTGALTPVSTRPIDFRAVGGLWTPCAGSVTPWQTHLGSEEYEPDARAFGQATTAAEVDSFFKPHARYFKVDPTVATLDELRAVLDPYKYGYAIEVTVAASGATTVAKHYAMGRRALELAYVMPDQKTVYLTDDGDNTGFYMFIAKTPGNLSVGKLYAMKWNQTSDTNGGEANAQWIPLGPEASDGDVKALLDAKTTFVDLFDTEAPNVDGTCPTAGFKPIQRGSTGECLRLKPGKELAASRLESRRYAAYVGATTEMNKEEGFTFDPDGMNAYVAITDVANGMIDGSPADFAGPNHVKLPANPCGTVYKLAVGKDATLGSDFVVKSWKGLISGTTWGGPNSCSLEGIANPDNLSFVKKYNTLIIGEDCGKLQHQNDAMWSMDLTTNKITRILTTPYGSESTSVYHYPNVGGFAYVMAVVQHPYGESDTDKLEGFTDPVARAKAKMPYVGYIGPMPKMD